MYLLLYLHNQCVIVVFMYGIIIKSEDKLFYEVGDESVSVYPVNEVFERQQSEISKYVAEPCKLNEQN